jgi:hypothetical protein
MTDNVPPTDAGKAREGLIDELETINNYEEMASKTSDPKLRKQFEEITDDERVHVGNFAEMISEKDPKAEPKMREGLKEAKEFEKTYRLYSIQEMMCGASHFEKARAGTGNFSENYESRSGLNRSRGKWWHQFKFLEERLRHTRPAGKIAGKPLDDSEKEVNYGTRNADVPKKRYPYSRAQVVEAIATGAAYPLTYQDIQMYEPLYTKDKSISAAKGPDGNYYVVRLDPDDGKYHQIIRKKDADGRYWDFYMPPRQSEHYSKSSPALMTTDWAMKLYKKFNDKQAARAKNREVKKEEVWPDEFTSYEERKYGVDPRPMMDKAFDRARKESPDFTDFSLVTAVLKMPPKVYARLDEDVKDVVDDITNELERRVFGTHTYLDDPVTAATIRKNIITDVYESPQKYIHEMGDLMDEINDFVEHAIANEPKFGKLIFEQGKKIRRNATDREFDQAMIDSRSRSSSAYEPYQVMGSDGNPMKDSDGNPVYFDVPVWALQDALHAKAKQQRNEVRNTRLFHEPLENSPTTGPVTLGSGKGEAYPVERINTEKTVNSKLIPQAQKQVRTRKEEKKNNGHVQRLKGSVPRDPNDTDVWGNPVAQYGVEVTGTTGAEVPTPRAKQKKTSGDKKTTPTTGDAGKEKKPEDQSTNAGEISENKGKGKKQLKNLKNNHNKKGKGNVKKEKEPTEPFTESASFEEMLKSANARQWAEKGLPSGCMEATLPAYYRTVTIGSDRDAINVYEHKKMPVGGDGISVKKVPGIGPKMSTKGDE